MIQAYNIHMYFANGNVSGIRKPLALT